MIMKGDPDWQGWSLSELAKWEDGRSHTIDDPSLLKVG